MDVDDVIILVLSLWVFMCISLVSSIELFLTLLLIWLLIVFEVSSMYIHPNVKSNLKMIIYVLLFAFAVIVIRKVMNILHIVV